MNKGKSSIALADYSRFGKIKVSGPDNVTVLHNILTNDIKKLPVGGHCPAALLTHTGKILLYMEVYRFEDFLILVIENGLASKAIPLIDKFIITEEVSLEDVTDQYSFFQSYSPKLEKFLISPVIPPSNDHQIDDKTAEMLRIEAGIPLYGIDMDENTILSEMGLDEIAVSETKGCYPGQEVVARIKTYKGLTKKLCRFVLEGDFLPKKGDKIYTNFPNMSFPHALGGNPQNSKNGSPIKPFGDDIPMTEIGWVTSATYSPTLQKIAALGYLLKGYFEEERRIKVSVVGKWVEGISKKI